MAPTSALVGGAHPGAFKGGYGAGALKEAYAQSARGSDITLTWSFSIQNLPDNQCVFMRGLRVTRVLGILPRRLRAAAGPNVIQGEDHDEDEPDRELISIPSSTTVKYPFQR